MFEIFSVLFGGAYLGAKLISDDIKSEEAKYEIWSNQVSDESWKAKHTDRTLARNLLARMDDPSFYSEVLKEVIPAFKQMPSWTHRDGVAIRADQLSPKMLKRSASSIQNFIARERNITLDIMLANRGKVSTDSAQFGYFVRNRALSTVGNIEREDELARWIESTLKSQGIDVELTYIENGCRDRKYVWVGSPAHRWTTPEFF